MASSDFQIVNLALVRLGTERITSLSDGSRNANEANAVYTLLLDEVLRSHPWNWAIRNQTLEKRAANVLTITGITQADPGVVTYTGTDPEDGDEYLIEDVEGMVELNDGVIMIEDVDEDADTFAIHDENGDEVDTSGYTAYSANGTATEQIPHSSGWDYVYHKPDDCLRILQINDNPDALYSLTEKGLFFNDDECEVEYVRRVTDVSTYDSTFVDLLAWRIAMELAIVLTGDKKKLEMAQRAWIRAINYAQSLDAKESHPAKDKFDKYKQARR